MDMPTQDRNIRCPRCDTLVRADAHFCRNCGAPVASAPVLRHCPVCQAALRAESRYCGACGYRLGSDISQGVENTPRVLPTTPATLHQRNTYPAWVQETPPATPEASVYHQLSPPEKKTAKEQQGDSSFTIFDKMLLVQSVLIAILLVAQILPQINSGVYTESGIEYGIPLAAFLVLAISLAIGYWSVLACALRARWSVRFLVALLGTSLLAIQPVMVLVADTARAGTEPYTTEAWLSYAQLGTLALFWIWALSVPLYRRHVKQVFPDFIGVLALLLIYYGLAFVGWLAFAHAKEGKTGIGFLLNTIGLQVLFLPLFFVLLMLLTGTGLLRIGQALAWAVVFTRQDGIEQLRPRLSPYLPTLTTIVAVAAIVYEVLQAGSGLLGGLVAIAVLAGIVILLIRFARVDSSWPEELPSMWLFLGAIFIFIDTVLLVDVNPFSEGQGYLVITTLSEILRVPIALGALTIALFVIVRGRMGKPKQGAVGFFLAMLALLVLTAQLPSVLLDVGLSVPQPRYLLGAMIVCVALGILAWMLRSGRQLKETTLATAFLLLVGLLIVEGLYWLLGESATLGMYSTVLLALIFLLPALSSSFKTLLKKHFNPKPGSLLSDLWSPLTADEQEADSEMPWFFPEGKPDTLLKACTLITNALILYLGTLRAPITGAVPPSYLSSDLTASAGLILLGPALVLLGFILRMRHRVPHLPVLVPTSQSATRISARAILASGTLVTVLITTLLLTTALPRLIQTSEYQQYIAAIPGPDCDPGAATWSVTPGEPISTTCLHSGLQVMVKAQSDGTVEFTPPSGVFTQNYRVSVQVNFGSLSSGCIAIVTHALATNGYQNAFCTDRSWNIKREGKSTILLATGQVVPARTYTIEAIADGPNQRLAINGVEVGTVSDTAFSATGFIDLTAFNLSDAVGTVVFSNFAFTPLPALPPASPQSTYQASTPGVACDNDGAQWALMSPQEVNSTVECRPNGMLFQLPGRNFGLEGFTPPSGLFPQDYQVSIQVNLSALLEGCVAIGERASGGDSYDYTLCTGGAWSMNVANGNTSSPLASGKVTPALVYTIEASVQGPHVQLVINGVKVGSASNSKFTTTAFIGLGFANNSNDAGTVLFSNFVFTPLP